MLDTIVSMSGTRIAIVAASVNVTTARRRIADRRVPLPSFSKNAANNMSAQIKIDLINSFRIQNSSLFHEEVTEDAD
jgi:hypothetical protein